MSYVHLFSILTITYDIKANAGDSRSVLAVKGEVKPLSFDHKPTNDGECATLQVFDLHLLIPIHRREGTDFKCWWLC